MIVGQDQEDQDVEVLFDYSNNLISYSVREPTMDELEKLPLYIITSDQPWEPNQQHDNHNYKASNIQSSQLEGRWINHPEAHQRIIKRLSSLSSNSSLHCLEGSSIDPEQLA